MGGVSVCAVFVVSPSMWSSREKWEVRCTAVFENRRQLCVLLVRVEGLGFQRWFATIDLITFVVKMKLCEQLCVSRVFR